MSEYLRQKREKPSIEELTERYLQGKRRVDLLGFVRFLRDNAMSPVWGSTNSYNVSSRNRRVCIIKLEEDAFVLYLYTQYGEEFNLCFADESAEMKRFLLDGVVHCCGCGGCKPGLDVDILGEPHRSACVHTVIRIRNPDDAQLALARKLVLLHKQAIRDGRVQNVSYIAIKNR